MKYTFEMVDEQVEKIVVDELKWAYEHSRCISYGEDGFEDAVDEELVSALEKVLEYYMPLGEFVLWKQSLNQI